MDETLLINKSIMENSLLPNLQNNLFALDLMRKSECDSEVIENETMLVKYSPEPSSIKSIDSHSLLNNTTLESLFPRGCQDNRLWAKSFKNPLRLSKAGDSSMNESLKNSPENAMRTNKHKMDFTVNLTFNDTDKENSLSESSNKTNPFRKPTNYKKYSVNLNLNDTTQLSHEILSSASSTENSLLIEKSGNIFTTSPKVKCPPVIDLTLAESSENEDEEEVVDSMIIDKPTILSSRRENKRYSLRCDLDSSCDSLTRKTVLTNNSSNLKNEEQFVLIQDKKMLKEKSRASHKKHKTKDKKNQSFQIGGTQCNSKTKARIRSSSQRSKINNQAESATNTHKIDDSVVNSTNNENQLVMNAENVPKFTIKSVELSSQMNKTGRKLPKIEKEKCGDCKDHSFNIFEKDTLQDNTSSLEHITVSNGSNTEECEVGYNQTLTQDTAHSLSDHALQNSSINQNGSKVGSNSKLSANVDVLDVTLKDSMNLQGRSKGNSIIEDGQLRLVVEKTTMLDHNYAIDLQGKHKETTNNNIKEKIWKQSIDDRNNIFAAHCTDDTAPVKKNVPQNKREKSTKVVNEVECSMKVNEVECSMKNQTAQMNKTMNVSSHKSLDISSVSQEINKQKGLITPLYKSPSNILKYLHQEDKCILKKDSMEYFQTHIMDNVENDGYDCRLERPELLDKNDSLSLIKSLENGCDTFFPSINAEGNNSSRVEISYLSKTIADEFDSISSGSNLEVENQEKLSLNRLLLENNVSQNENEVDMIISTPNKYKTDDHNTEVNDCSSRVKTPSKQPNNANSQIENQESENDGGNMEKQQKTPKTSKELAGPLVDNLQHSNGTSQIALVESIPKVINDKFAHQDILEKVKEGEQHITEPESNNNSHLEKSLHSVKSQSRRAECSITSEGNKNGCVTILVENNLPGEDDGFNFAIPSLPSKRVSSQKSKRNETVNENTPAKRTRSSTRKSRLSEKTINNLSYDTSLDVSSINESHPHKKILIYHSTPVHKVPVRHNQKTIYNEINVDEEVTNTNQSKNCRSTRRTKTISQDISIEPTYNRDKFSDNEQSCTTMSRSRSSRQRNSLPETAGSFSTSNGDTCFDTSSVDSDSLNNKSKTRQSPHLDPIEKHLLKMQTLLTKNKRTHQDSLFNIKGTPKKKKVANVNKLPKLYKPAKWVDKHLYQFLENSLSKKYKLESRKVSEEFVIMLYHTYSLVIQGHTEPAISNLKLKLKELGLCRTQLDFFLFVMNYMPFNFRKCVLPLSGAYNTPIQPKILPFDEL